MEILISLATNAIDGITLVYLCDIVFEKKYRLNRIITILLIILAHFGAQFLLEYIPGRVLPSIGVFALMFGLSYFYKGKIVKHFFTATSITVIGLAVEGVIYAIFSSMGEMTEGSYIVGLMISKTLTLIIISLIRVFIKKSTSFKDKRVSVFIFICETISVGVLFLLLFFMTDVPQKYYGILGAISFLIVVLNLCIYLMFDNISELANAKAEKIKAYDNLIKTEQQYQHIMEKYKMGRSYIHDNNKHLSTIRRYVFEGKNEDAIKYIDKARNINNMRNDFINSGNVVVDALVNEIKDKCVSMNIICDIDVSINNNDLKIEAPDFSVVLGNLLDNAYNAVERMSENRDRRIEVKIFKQEDKIVIKINNTYVKTDMTKSYGIQNVETVVEKYNGIYYAEQTENMYCASVFIPI